MLLLQKNSIQRAFMACRMLSNDDSMRFSEQGSSMMRVFAWFDGDLEAQDLGGLAEVLFVDDADDLAGDVAGRRAMLLLAVCLQLVQIVGGLREIIEVDAGAHIARPDFSMHLRRIFFREVHAEQCRPIVPLLPYARDRRRRCRSPPGSNPARQALHRRKTSGCTPS